MISHAILVGVTTIAILSFQEKAAAPVPVPVPNISDREKSALLKIAAEAESDFVATYSVQSMSWFMNWQDRNKEYAFWLTPLCNWAAGSNNEKVRPAAMRQLFLSGVAFKLSNPAQLRDLDAVETASIEGLIRAYQNRLKSDPNIKSPNMDRLVVIQAEGRLCDTLLTLKRQNAK